MKIRRPAGWRAALPAAGLVALALYLLPAVVLGLAGAWARVHTAQTEGNDDARAAFVRQRGAAYVEGIERIRAALPEDSEYLILFNEGAPVTHLVRFDLAPRRAVFGGHMRDLAANVTPEKLSSLPRWTVIPRIVAPGPRLVETRTLAEKGAIP